MPDMAAAVGSMVITAFMSVGATALLPVASAAFIGTVVIIGASIAVTCDAPAYPMSRFKEGRVDG